MDRNMIANQLSEAEKRMIYIHSEKTLLNQEAMFADETDAYRKPAEPKAGDRVTFSFRTGRDNVDGVYLQMGETEIPMQIKKQDPLFDFYQCDVIIGEEPVRYYFKIEKTGQYCFYNKKGVIWEREEFFDFSMMPGFSTPDWAKGAVFYQIFTDRFYNGDPTNDVMDKEYVYIKEPVRKVNEWGRYPAAMDVREFYGGDLQGVIDKLDYLQDLGVDVLYFNPLFVSPSNHKYDIQDYDYIDPHLGVILEDGGTTVLNGETPNSQASRYINRVTNKKNLEASNELFIHLVEEAHRRGMKVILDGVFNHCGSFNKWMDRECIYEYQQGYEKGAFIEEQSPYRSFFRFFEHGTWPYNENYDGWWGHDTLPKLNYEESPKLFEYIMRIAEKWVSPPFHCDGWRLDVAADLGRSMEYNHHFWREFRKTVKKANPNALILAEHYGDPGAWLQGDQWDSVMNYDAFMEPITWFLTGMEKHSDEKRPELIGDSEAFFSAMTYHMSRYQGASLQVAMNELSNHDHSRFLTRTNGMVGRTASMGAEAANQNINKAVFREAVLMQMTWPGAPTLYYGDEAGLCGWTDPDNRRTYPWGKEDKDLIQYHKDLIRIHKEHKALMRGSIKFLTGGKGNLSYGRFTEEEKILVAVNNGMETIQMQIPVWEIGILDGTKMKQLILSYEEDYTLQTEFYEVEEGCVTITMPMHSAIILIK